ncbi:hypothetical protein G5V58_00015 [Nocardioides anomalus]|uniref:Uncharacterized protein n=1 Tax=Nocardioides anomalus TaxID=2712223 RepID=A0A6G6W7Q4_9ACTN|nr:hypothetical protein [Nocardioides anomalus]QIG41368.1 hypothetical protein G5V58_00015 [Nocardioides anomalus]
MTVPDLFRRLVDDAAVFPPGDAPLPDALAAYAERRGDQRDLVGSLVVRDTDLPLLRGFAGPVSVVVTGGAGQLAGPVALCERLGLALAGVEIALRDLDDLGGNARRVTTAAADLGDVPLFVELPRGPGEASWLAAADEVAGAGHRLKFRTLDLPTPVLAGWIDAALDRETPFKATAGLHHAVRHAQGHGFLNVLAATAALWDGGSVDDAVAVLDSPEPPVPDARARRWFTSFGSCSITEPYDDLRTMGLLDE